MIYLASPYSHPDSAVRQARFEAVCRAAAGLIAEGRMVFSPIAHSHPIATLGGLETDFGPWADFDRKMLAACDRMIVLRLPGWRESRGVQAEIDIAISRRMDVTFLDEVEA